MIRRKILYSICLLLEEEFLNLALMETQDLEEIAIVYIYV